MPVAVVVARHGRFARGCHVAVERLVALLPCCRQYELPELHECRRMRALGHEIGSEEVIQLGA